MSLRTGLLAMTAIGVVMGGLAMNGAPALADGDSSKTAAAPPPPRAFNSNSVSVDYSALDSVPNRSLLLPTRGGSMGGAEGPVVLRPPAGVKAITPSVIRLRPPPGVQRAAAPAPKAEAAKPETKMAIATPAPLPPEPKAAAPKPAAPPATTPAAAPPAAKSSLPATTAAAPPAPAPKAAAPAAPPAAAPPAPKQTQVAGAPPAPAPTAPAAAAQQPRSLLTPPPATAAAAPAPAKAEPPKVDLPKVETPKAPGAKTAEAPAETKLAALPPPAKTPQEPDTFTIAFKIGGADLPGDATAGVKALAARMTKDPTARIQLVAYASDPDKSISRSRRLSLERAVNVRKVLLAAGVESTRIDIRALGEQSGNGAPDRVDAITVKR
ncbi:MAG: OmpA family protein [Rhodospirillaceae bacterium]